MVARPKRRFFWVLALLLFTFSAAGQVVPRLVFLIPSEAGSLSPLRDLSTAGLGAQAHVFDTLVDYSGPDLALTPKLATSWDVVDEATWVFHLREGVTFHDGSPFTADDVVFSLELYGSPESVRSGYVSTVESVDAVDDYTVRIQTTGPDAGLLARLAYLYIVPHSTYEQMGDAAFGVAPVGSGPYRFEEWRRGEYLRLSGYADYWGGTPAVGELEIRTVVEAATRVAELRTGRADAISSLPIEMVASLLADADIEIVSAPGVRQVYYPLNATRPPFDDVRVRQAVNYAVDREAIVGFILEGYGEARAGPFAERQWGADRDAERYTYDPERAKALLVEAGYPNGLDVVWDMTPGVVVKSIEIAEALANMLGQVGVRVSFNMMENGQRIDRYLRNDYDLTMVTWSLQSDPDSILSGLGMESTSGRHFSDPGVDQLLRLGRATVDPAERELVYQELERVLIELAPWLMVHAQDEIYAVRQGLGWVPYPFAGNAGMTYFVPTIGGN